MDRIFYSSSVHDEAEINAVVEVLRAGPQGLWPGRRVNAMEREVAKLFGKATGVMCNSGTSALYLAVELLDMPKGSEVITSALTFSSDVAPLLRGGYVPVLVDSEPDTYCANPELIEELISDKTKAILVPNLVGNVPDWDAIRAIADSHGLAIIEDSCDTLGATLCGTPTGTRSTISVTSFANSHIITCAGGGGMVLTDSLEWRDRAVMLRRWGRRSELHFFGSKRRDHNFWEDLDGIHYDNQQIFDEVAWNFEPSEIGAAFGLEQLKKLPSNLARRKRNFAMYSDFFAQHSDLFVLPRQLPDVDTSWLGYPLTIKPGAGFARGDMQEVLDARSVDTRTIWTGNVSRQPMFRNATYRLPKGGLPVTDTIMERGVLLPLSHAIDDDGIAMVTGVISDFLKGRR